MPKYTYLTGSQANNLANSLVLDKEYKDAAYWLGQGAKYNLTKFLQLKKAEANNTSVSTNEEDLVEGDVSENIDIAASEEEKLVGKEGAEILKQALSEAAKKTLQMYIDTYMAPLGNTDIKFRLGKVTGVKNTVAVYDENDVESIRKEYDKDNVITDNLGRIYTRTNLEASFNVKYWSDKTSSIKSMNIPYVNLYFPPYKVNQSLMNLDKWNQAMSAWQNLVKYGTFKASEPTYNLSTLKNSRGDFTYRAPAFKAINDNINFLQFIMEQVTGVVSTYLTDWDISMYIQEGLVSDGTYNIGEAGAIWMLYRIRQDNPLAGTRDAIYYKDDRALAFGSITAACSKLFGDNELLWVPNYYPLSTFWTPYWGVNDIYNENGTMVKTPRQLVDEHILVKATNGDTSAYIPAFYYPELGGDLQNYIDIKDNLSFAQKVKLTDERNAALSCWTSWDCHSYSDILYSTPDDGLSDIDTTLQGIALKSKKIQSALKTIRGNVIDAGGVPIDESFFSMSDRAANVVSTSGGSAANDPSISGSSGGGGGNMAAKLAKYLLTGSKGGSSGSSSTTEDIGDISTTDGALNLANKSATGYTDANSLVDNLTSSPGADSIKSPANTTGIPQNGPALFGGPHGGSLSPRTPQSYFQADNILLRNQPRLDADLSHFNTFEKDTGYGYGARGISTQDFYHAEGQGFGIYDQSPELAMHNLKHGIMRWNMGTCYTVQQYWDWFPGTIRTTYSPCSTYIDWPTSLNSARISYPTLYDEQGNPKPLEIRWSWVTHYQPYTADAGWFEGSYWWYNNENCRSSIIYRSGVKYWKVDSYGPHRYGYVTQYVYKQYKRYKCGSLPDVSWHITETSLPAYTTHSYSPILLWFVALASIILRAPQLYMAYYVSGTKKMFRLTIPGSNYGSSNYVVAYSDIYGRDVIDGYSGNERYLIEYLKKEYPNNDGKMIFAQSNDGYYSFLNNGPNAIFEIPVVPTSRTLKYRVLRSRRHRCHRDYYTAFATRQTTYLEVNPLAPTLFYGDLRSEPYHGNYNNPDSFASNSIPDKYLRRTVSVTQLMNYSQVSSSSLYRDATFGVSGYGIYSFLPGLENSYIEDSQFETYSRLLCSSSLTNAWASIRFRDVPMPAPVVTSWSSSFYSTEDKCMIYSSQGFPSYRMGYLNSGMRRGIARAFTRATFYDMKENVYYVGLDASLKLFMTQLLWQTSFLKHTRSLFIDNVSWPVVRKLIDEFIDKSVSSVSKIGFNSNTQREYYEETKFNYWIMKAEKYFPVDPKDQINQKNILIESITGRINTFEQAFGDITRIVSKPADQWTWNDIRTAYGTIDTVKRKLDVSNLEEYIMSYLNVLYEYRKYFINLRFNKQDGTMWVMRQLESIIPQMVFANVNNQEVPDFSELNDARMYGAYPVAFYDLTNTLNDKLDALQSDKVLDEDRITTVYIKVKYVDFDAYEEDQDRIERKVQSAPTIVRIEENGKYAEIPADGSYFLDSWERTDNWNKKKYNSAKLKANPSVSKSVLKVEKDYDETGPWYIRWGNEQNLTPIKFGVPAGINIGNMTEMLKLNTSSDAYTLACAGKDLADYWTVRLPSSAYPRTPGYRTKVKLKPWNPNRLSPYTRFTADAESTVVGEFGYALWPITEAQGSMSQDDKNSGDYMNNMLKAFVQQTENS